MRAGRKCDEQGSVALLRALVLRSPGAGERALRQFALGSDLWRTGSEREALAVWEQIDVDKADYDMQRQMRATLLFGQTALRLDANAVVSRAALAFFVETGSARDGARLAFAEAMGSLPLAARSPSEISTTPKPAE